MLFTAILASLSLVTALPNTPTSLVKTGICKDIKPDTKCSTSQIGNLFNSFMPVASSIPNYLLYNMCKCLRSTYAPNEMRPETLKYDILCINPGEPFGMSTIDVAILSQSELGEVVEPAEKAESPKPILQIIQAWEKEIIIRTDEGKDIKIKRYSQVLVSVAQDIEPEKQLVELLSDTAEVSPEVLAEASQAAKDFGLKTKLEKLTVNTCSV